MMRNKHALSIWLLIAALLLALPVHVFTRPSDGGVKIITTGGSSLEKNGGTINGDLVVLGTSTTAGDRVYGSDTVTVIHGGHTYYFPASGMAIVTNADIAAVAGLGAEGNIVTLLGDKIDAVNGTCTGLTLTNPTILGIFTFSGSGFTWSTGSSTLASNGTMTIKTTSGSNAPVVLDPDGSGSVFLSLSYGTPTLKNVPQSFVWAGTSTITGTSTETVMKTISVPANFMGTGGEMEVEWFWTMGTTTAGISKAWRVYVYDGVGTTTIHSRGSNITSNASSNMARFVNLGTTTSNLVAGNTSTAPYVESGFAIGNTPVGINTGNPLTVSFAFSINGSETTQTCTLSYFKVTTHYAD